jgi:hypothetical protein
MLIAVDGGRCQPGKSARQCDGAGAGDQGDDASGIEGVSVIASATTFWVALGCRGALIEIKASDARSVLPWPTSWG